MKRLLAVGFFAGLLIATAAADPVAPKSQDSVIYPRGTPGAESASQSSSGTGSATLVIGGFLAVGGLWLLWRSRRDAKLVATKGKLVVAETKSLGNKQYLVVASYGDQKFLLGVCPGKIDLLSQLEKGASPS